MRRSPVQVRLSAHKMKRLPERGWPLFLLDEAMALARLGDEVKQRDFYQ